MTRYKPQNYAESYAGNVLPEPIMKLEIKVMTYLDGEHREELEDKLKECIRKYGVRAKISSSTGNEMTVNPPKSTKTLKYGH